MASALADGGRPTWTSIFFVAPNAEQGKNPVAVWTTLEGTKPAEEMSLVVLELVFAAVSAATVAHQSAAPRGGSATTERAYVDAIVAAATDCVWDPVGRLMRAFCTGKTDMDWLPERGYHLLPAVKKNLMGCQAARDVVLRTYNPSYIGPLQVLLEGTDAVGFTPYSIRVVHSNLAIGPSARHRSQVDTAEGLDARYYEPMRTLGGTGKFNSMAMTGFSFDNFLLKRKQFALSTLEGGRKPGYNRLFALNMATVQHKRQVRGATQCPRGGRVVMYCTQ